MRYRKLTNGDYTFGGNATDFVSGELAVAEAVKTNLLLLSGEWWEDTSKGVPVFQSILGQTGQPGNLRAVDLLIQTTALNTPDVIGLSKYKGTYDSVKRTFPRNLYSDHTIRRRDHFRCILAKGGVSFDLCSPYNYVCRAYYPVLFRY